LAEGHVQTQMSEAGSAWPEMAVAFLAPEHVDAEVALLLELPSDITTWARAEAAAGDVTQRYSREVPYLRLSEADVLDFARRLMEVKRPWSCVAVLAAADQEQLAADRATSLVEQVLYACLTADGTEAPERDVGHALAELIDVLERDGVVDEDLGQLERGFEPLLRFRRHNCALARILAADPESFVRLLTLAYEATAASRFTPPDWTGSARSRRALCCVISHACRGPAVTGQSILTP